MERIARVWIGNDYVEFELDLDGEFNEDELYEAVVNYVYDNISVEIL